MFCLFILTIEVVYLVYKAQIIQELHLDNSLARTVYHAYFNNKK